MTGPATSEPPAARLDGVTVRFGDRTVLHDLDLEVRGGEFVALAGPNGSGKTTLLRVLLGFVVPEGGDVRLFGRRLASLSIRERARRVAWVPQEELVRDDPTVRDYVGYGRYAYRGRFDAESPEERRRIDDVLRELELLDRSDDGIQTLSGGERQRVVLGRALVQATPLLLLDEPTSHLDIGHQLDLLERVRGLSRRAGTAVVAALHDLNLAARFADRIVVLSRGRKYDDGPPGRVLTEALVGRVWGVAADLRRDPRSGVPYLLPHRRLLVEDVGRSGPGFGPVHVVGGGGSAAPLLRGLTDAGFRVTAGALHLLDTDAETAETLGVPAATEVPFAPLGEEVRALHREMLARARAIIIAPFAVGPSNLANLVDVAPFVGRTPTYLLAEAPIVPRDFAGGEGRLAWQRLIDAGATELPSVEGVLDALRALAGRSDLSRPGAPAASPS